MTSPKSNSSDKTQFKEQCQALLQLNRKILCNPQEQASKRVPGLLKSLMKFSFCDSLQGTYKTQELDKLKEYASREFEAMGQINRNRVASLATLSDEAMHNTLYESLFLFDVNPTDTPNLELQEKTGQFDEEGHPVLTTHEYKVFLENAPHAIDGVERFLPAFMRGESGTMHQYLQETYPKKLEAFQKKSGGLIKTLTTIGSLGGIGHKPDSDMDAQVILNTSPEFQFRWSDADFFIALITQILNAFFEDYYTHVLSAPEHEGIKRKIISELQADYSVGLSPEEQRVIDMIFSSSFHRALQQKLLAHFKQKKPEVQQKLFRKQIVLTLRDNPDCEYFFKHIIEFFPFLKKENPGKLHAECFPYSLKHLSQDKALGWVIAYYREHFLGGSAARQIVWKYATNNNLSPSLVTDKQEYECFLENLRVSPQILEVLKSFLYFLNQKLSVLSRGKIPEVVQLLKQSFRGQLNGLDKKLIQSLWSELNQNYRDRMVSLINERSEWEAKEVEAPIEYPLYRKIQQAEAYLTKKYPSTEIHYFNNILRKQRAGHHTPFLVSPEGSMAYSLMLNDFLLNPAIILAGLPPMPFDLPKDFKVLAAIGVFPDEEWKLTQTLSNQPPSEQPPKRGEEYEGPAVETFLLRQLPNWGEATIPRSKFLEHAMPIFLRESEKVSHRNLPKALLNCWWLEMIVCIDAEDEPPTSLTRLLFDPNGRYFITHEGAPDYPKTEKTAHYIGVLRQMEEDFPPLVNDPWWLKFTEMITRFEDPEIQKQILFCFAQHIRVSDIINYENEGNAIWLDETTHWRTRSLVAYYDIFYADNAERQNLIRFSQGRDDIGNTMEQLLKQLFLKSMKNVERALCKQGLSKALHTVSEYLHKLNPGGDPATARKFLTPLLALVNQRLALEDKRVLTKVRKKVVLTSMEKLQARSLYDDHKKLQTVTSNIVDYFQQFNLKIDESWVKKAINSSKVKIAGDPLENVIFKYHFERNFEHKAFQVRLPIAKSLSIPRPRIALNFNGKSGKWSFDSILSKTASTSGSSAAKAETVMHMFEAHLADGLARCVFSGYLGYEGKVLSSFDKPPAKSHSEIATNPVTGHDLMALASDLKSFFAPFHSSSRELMENVHYIREIYMICHVNRFNTLSLVIRDNFGEQFVVNFDIRSIPVKKVPPNLRVGGDDQLPEFFLRLNTKKCRLLFMKYMAALKIPLLTTHQPRLKIWVNHGRFDLPVAPKFYQIYINGIATALWPEYSIGTREHLAPPPLTQTFDEMGWSAIREHSGEDAP